MREFKGLRFFRRAGVVVSLDLAKIVP